MVYRNIQFGLILGAILGFTAACGGPPYIYNSSEFNRESDRFNKELTTRNNVTVCYRKGATSTQAIQSIAVAECGRFGKAAYLQERNLSTCPLMTPFAAVFHCLGPGDKQPKG